MRTRNSLIALTASVATLAFAGSAAAATNTFTNPASIAPPDRAIGALPAVDFAHYPSTIPVAGVAGTVEDVHVTLKDVKSTFPGDIDVVLVSPAGRSVMLMSDSGDTQDLTGQNLTFSDTADHGLPANDPIPTGTYL